MNSREGLTISGHDKDKLISDYRKRFAEYGYSPKTLGWDKGKFRKNKIENYEYVGVDVVEELIQK